MDNRLTAIQKFIDVIVEQIFQNQPAEELVLRRSVIGDLARTDFYAAISRSLSKHLKVMLWRRRSSRGRLRSWPCTERRTAAAGSGSRE